MLLMTILSHKVLTNFIVMKVSFIQSVKEENTFYINIETSRSRSNYLIYVIIYYSIYLYVH